MKRQNVLKHNFSQRCHHCIQYFYADLENKVNKDKRRVEFILVWAVCPDIMESYKLVDITSLELTPTHMHMLVFLNSN